MQVRPWSASAALQPLSPRQRKTPVLVLGWCRFSVGSTRHRHMNLLDFPQTAGLE